ncbi:carbohydrate ABC transporter permease [Enterococcus lemanii]|jgi:putative aldouronate transport system permease protein|uniref:Carbohydrate ABC transporter permease n=1 Tax=Enterococcus lemanii TaxID=1159752 RepID=A0ABV9MYM2_9ENTE|nr:carbohydrate ABC transporter permease [Enterococcus lemanii]MBM7708257.1 putative aldouronate transport system permease protein [Enterococcus lemanii]
MNKLHNTKAGKVFDVFNIIFLFSLAIIMILPFIYVIAASFSTESEIVTRSFFLWPKEISLESYRYILSTPAFIRSLIITIGVTIVGTLVQLFFTFSFAYPLSRSYLKGRKVLLNMVIVAMLFSGGMIPTFLVVKGLGLLDTYWALILPAAISPFNLMIIKNFFQEIPMELEESARMDGASELTIFSKIMLPLSKPVIATFTLFYAVGIWNDFMSGLLYINDSAKWPIQLLLRQITLSSSALNNEALLDPNYIPPEQGIKFAVIVVATLPILIFYPFLQKHFAKGMMVGSVKG